MAEELELKAVVPDADHVRARLHGAGGASRFRGRMSDRRYDRAGELTGRDEVLRVRRYLPADGYKQREEYEIAVAADPTPLLAALGYSVVHAIDREVEVYDVAGAAVRLERYPDMDTLIEVEGSPDAIEGAIRASGLARASFTAESLTDFVRRFEARTGRPAVLARP